MKIFKCYTCGNLIEMIEDSGMPPFCCGKAMREEAAERSGNDERMHIPVSKDHVNRDTRTIKVCVGKETHPMTPLHRIKWIQLETDLGVYRKYLNAKEEPTAVFSVSLCERVKGTYAYCSMHGLWKGN